MKALTIHQPWASLIMIGYKRVETRSICWGSLTGQRLAIHAGQRDVEAVTVPQGTMINADVVAMEINAFLPDSARCEVSRWHGGATMLAFRGLPRGAVLGIVLVEDVFVMQEDFRRTEPPLERMLGNWQYGRIGYRMRDPQPLLAPERCRGQQGLWDWAKS